LASTKSKLGLQNRRRHDRVIFSSSLTVLRPCERQNFPDFTFSRVSELFGFQSSEFFWKNPVFPNSQKFCKKSSEISSDQKSLLLGQKTLFLWQKQGFPNIPNLRDIWNLFYSKFSKNYKKITSKSNFYFCKKLVPT